VLGKNTHSVLIIGYSPCAARIAGDLSAMGEKVVLAAPDTLTDLAPVADVLGSDRILANAQMLDLEGAAGNFSVRMSTNGNVVNLRPVAIVLADKDARQPKFDEYGLSPGPSVFSLSEFGSLVERNGNADATLEKIQHLVFLNGVTSESHPVITEEVLRLSILLQDKHNIQTYILTRNLKVAADGREALFRESKAAGTLYVKFEDAGPEIRQDPNKAIRFTFDDDVTGLPLSLAPDAVVVDEALGPSETTMEIARRLGLETDRGGFVQGDNVHRLTVKTNIKGIFVAGSARKIASDREHRMDGGNVAVAVGSLPNRSSEFSDRAAIDRWQCVRCLSCFRVCSHGAIQVQDRVTVMPEACERCGICTAECPRHAITLSGLDVRDLMPQVSPETGPDAASQEFAPTIMAFCCSRSAVSAADLARCMGCALPERLTVLEVPCAGCLSYEHVFTAFRRGADGVMVITCHRDNCHSSRGNRCAHHRVEQLSEMFRKMEFSPERLCSHSLASNMGMEFAEILRGFEATLRDLGPSKLKQ